VSREVSDGGKCRAFDREEDAEVKTQTVHLGRKGSFDVKKGELHEDLGIPLGEKIPEERLQEAEHSKSPVIRRRAISAEGFRHMRHGG
jgi:hypothetical protein